MTLHRIMSAVALAGVVTACDSQTPRSTNQLTVTTQVTNGGSPTAGTTVVEIQSATLVLGGLKLETAGIDSTVDWVLQQSIVVPLELNGTASMAYDVDVTPGIYKELEISVDKLEVANPAEDPLIARHPGLADASILIDGTVTRLGQAAAFSFAAAIDIDLELPFATPMEFTSDDNPVALVMLEVDVGGWFQGPSGALDPTDPANRSDIEGNIQNSFDVYEDG